MRVTVVSHGPVETTRNACVPHYLYLSPQLYLIVTSNLVSKAMDAVENLVIFQLKKIIISLSSFPLEIVWTTQGKLFLPA